MSYGASGSRYGSFRWGDASRLESTTERRRGTTTSDDTITAAEAYGKGWKLASNEDIENGLATVPFDYVTDPETGDFKTVEGVEFLIQGVARRLTGEFSQSLGRVWDQDVQADLEIDIGSIVTEDERVVATDNVNIRLVDNAADSVVISLDIFAERAAHSAVFAVERVANA